MKRVKKQTKVASKKRKPARRQTPNTADTDYNNISDTGSGLDYLELPPTVRFSATIHTRRKADPNWMEKLDIDRVPDPKGLVRALVTALTASGYLIRSWKYISIKLIPCSLSILR